MPLLTLREYQPRVGVSLAVTQREQLRALTNSVSISPSAGELDRYDLTPGSSVGAIHLDGLDIVIEPKVPLDRLLFMLSYSLGHLKDLEAAIDQSQADDLPEAIVFAFVRQTRRALARGVQQGYRTVDDSALTLRGRLRVGDQIRRRYGPMPPAEITYDDYTVDIELNRLLRAATNRLARVRFRSDKSRAGLRGIEARLEGVSLVPYDPRRLPLIPFNRLNSRYRDAVTLAKFILRSTSFDLGHGDVPATAFLVDMNKAFEDFVVEALRDALGREHGVLVQGAKGRQLHLDEGREVTLLPDLSLWRDGRCVFVGDVKYKRVLPAEYPNADIYQATAYAVATELDSVLLIYAASEGEPTSHRIVHIGKQIDVAVLDLSARPAELLGQIDSLAKRIVSATLEAPARAA
jgi:5-methylcytosine-specific restriction enzyme subunit McrC